MLTFYKDKSKDKPKQLVKMKKIQTVVFHYDENAPVKSKRLSKGDKDESRFDIYTA